MRWKLKRKKELFALYRRGIYARCTWSKTLRPDILNKVDTYVKADLAFLMNLNYASGLMQEKKNGFKSR